jgi:hypothetical protein
VDDVEYNCARWMQHMRRGEWEQAWLISDHELAGRQRSLNDDTATDIGVSDYPPRHQQAIWSGQPLSGKRVLVRCYHGLGDTVQFAGLLPLLRKRASRVIVWAQPRLLPLLAMGSGFDELLPLHDGVVSADYEVDIELMELPYALRLSPASLPRPVPYFDVPVAERAAGSPLTAREPGFLRVGMVWQSGSWNWRRSIPTEQLRRLRSVPGIAWEIFQRDADPAAETLFGISIPGFRDVLEEARAMRALDLLITVDTFAAHLGGALGVRTWTLLPKSADWRWMDEGEECLWYPTMRLFRQRNEGDWPELLTRVAHELAQLALTQVK